MELVLVCLGREDVADKGNRLHGMLGTLLSQKLKPMEKEEILSEEYDIATSTELEGGLRQMCNLSDLVEERSIEKGIEQGKLTTLLSLVQDNLLSLEEAAKRAGLSIEEFRNLLTSNET